MPSVDEIRYIRRSILLSVPVVVTVPRFVARRISETLIEIRNNLFCRRLYEIKFARNRIPLFIQSTILRRCIVASQSTAAFIEQCFQLLSGSCAPGTGLYIVRPHADYNVNALLGGGATHADPSVWDRLWRLLTPLNFIRCPQCHR